MITWTNITVRLGDLRPWADNPRLSTKKQAQKILDSWKKFGQTDLVKVSPDLDVYDGHQRLSALLTIHNQDYVIEARQSSRHLTEAERREFVITHHAGAVGSWDWNELSNWQPAELHEWGFDESLLTNWRLDVASLGNFLESEEVGEGGDAPPQIDRAAELKELWGVESGQLWRMESRTPGNYHLLICGDCTDAGVVGRLSSGIKFDMMFTDPPYGVDYSGGIQFQKDGTVQRNNREKLAGDNTDMYCRFLPVVIPFVDGPCYVWFAASVGKPVYDAILGSDCQIHAMLIWNKTNATYAAMNAQYKQRHEPCMYFKPKRSTLRWIGRTDECTVWDMPRDPINDLHPTQKPVHLSERAIGNHEVRTVADFFAGGGSTLIGAENRGKQARCMELDEGYCAVILQRYQDAFGITAELIDTI